MEGQPNISNRIIIQNDGDCHGFDSDTTNGAMVLEMNDLSYQVNVSDMTDVQNSISSSHGKDLNQAEHTVAFEIVQEPFEGESLFSYSVFPQDDGQFEDGHECRKDTLSSTPVFADSSLGNEDDTMSNVVHHETPSSHGHSSPITLPVSFSSIPISSSLSSDEKHDSNLFLKVHPQSSSAVKSSLSLRQNDKTIDSGNTKLGKIIEEKAVESFVKMVVCRKITVRQVDSMTGVVLSTKDHMEEDEPVLIGVDCDADDINNVISALQDKLVSDFLPSKSTATSIDGGLKFLSDVSESRQKLNQSLHNRSTMRSSASKTVSSSRSLKYSLSSSNSGAHFISTLDNMKTEVIGGGYCSFDEKSASRHNIVNGSNLDNGSCNNFISQIPKSEAHLHSNGLKVNSNSSNFLKDQQQIFPTGAQTIKTELQQLTEERDASHLLLPKRRGRKRRWDKALGVAENLKTCQFCSKSFKSVKACTSHMKDGECISHLNCYICSKSFSDEELLEKHVMSHRMSPRTSSFYCTDCHRSYRTKPGFLKHFRMGTCSKRDIFEDGKTGDFPCTQCESRFSTAEYLKLHRYKIHENPNNVHKCSDCGKKFHSFLGYQRHKEAGRPCTEPLKCSLCGKTYKSKESFKMHMKHHKSEVSGTTFDCDICSRTYMTSTALGKHKLSHTGVKPYRCGTCGKEFAMRYQVKDHGRMHTGEKPFLCNLCGTSFSNKGHLGRHLRSHENGTLLRRGRPKKKDRVSVASTSSSGESSSFKLVDVSQTLQTIDGQTLQVVDGGSMFRSAGSTTPMIIQADNNTIIIAEGWPNSILPFSQPQPTSTAKPVTTNSIVVANSSTGDS